VSDALAAVLGLVAPRPLVQGPGTAPGLARLADGDGATASAWLRRCRQALGDGVRLIGPSGRVVERVAICGGSGASLVPAAIRAGADLLITGDVKHHAALEALSSGLAVIDAGHHATEWPFVPALAERLTAAGIGAIVSRVNTDPFREMP
jgi:putative NIF3 family GTP cyclohydrolase 1 type 2